MSIPTLENRLAARERPSVSPIHLQEWRNLLLVHWEFDIPYLQSLLPQGLYLDTYDQKAYVGVIPFVMQNIKPAFFGNIPGINFYELNVRTYVYDNEGNPGVWFLSLDASSWIAAKVGQIGFHLPYFHSKFRMEQENGWIHCDCTRAEKEVASFQYKIGELLGPAAPGSLEFFLLERYYFFSSNKRGELLKVRVHHDPYQMYEPIVKSVSQAPLLWNHVDPLHQSPIHQMVSRGVTVEVYPTLWYSKHMA